ncbi:hypothetical protein EIP86_005945 [Pleurotus ostreatoroseus]|nr:hypothetical protein EIP86_005945 [Pleurotus ostreatoroseus]
MVHLRINEREANPNPHINFITPLPGVTPAVTEDAKQLLRALAAQVRPVMKAHGFEVNSFEEYEHNQVFAGRNWNNGETIEIVLRGAHGFFLPTSWLMSTLCHELAHIKHMNHGPAFQALWAQLRREVRDLQAKGYYGDGAHTRARPTRRRPRALTTSKRKRKPGTRVTSKHAFLGAGEGEKVGGAGAEKDGFGRRAQSKRAREERAAAAEQRLLALQRPQAGPSTLDGSDADDPGEEDGEDDDIVEVIPETDQDRRTTLLGSMSASDADALKSGRQRFLEEFLLPSGIDNDDLEEEEVVVVAESSGPSCDTVEIGRKGAAAASSSSSSRPKRADPTDDSAGPPSKRRKASSGESSTPVTSSTKGKGKAEAGQRTLPLSYGSLVQDEVSFRRKEALGLAGGKQGDRTLGGASTGSAREGTGSREGVGQSRLLGLVPPVQAAPTQRAPLPDSTVGRSLNKARKDGATAAGAKTTGGAEREWSCLVCTLYVVFSLACVCAIFPRSS